MEVEYAPLQIVHIYMDTWTFDEVDRDVKITTEGQLGLIGGTMGLFTGTCVFMIISNYSF